jgi:AmmeMemoRadiSam system protein B/AmmeMemoRadiSam system protein A
VDGFLADARRVPVERPIALIAPHAGYIYSGQIAADAYLQARDQSYDLVVILGTNHTAAGFDGVSIYPDGGYRTPLGVAEIDADVTAALTAADESFTFVPAVHAREHSVEVQVPFVQRLFPEAKIVAAVIGQPELDLATRFGKALAEVLGGRQALIVSSSDLSHYPSYEEAIRVDRRMLEAVASLDPRKVEAAAREPLREHVPGLSTCACGEAPMMAAMVAAKELGATRGVVVSYANSGDAAVGDRSRVVGYGAVVLTTGPAESDASSLDQLQEGGAGSAVGLNDGDRESLLTLARETIHRYMSTGTVPLARDFPPSVCQKQGAFVTLKKHGQLRGCIGHLAEDSPLCRVVGSMALQAAFNDRRFAPLGEEELGDVEIEISVLTPMRRVPSADDILPGRDGVVLRKSNRSATYLPQVAVEQGWDRDAMLDHLCQKAGLPTACWRDGAELFAFQAVVFSESELASH